MRVGMRLEFAIAWILFLVLHGSAAADELATLSGRFVFDGKPPERKELKIDKDEPVCKKQLDESLVVNVKDHGIANVVVQLYLGLDKKPPVHPRLDELRSSKAVLRTTGCKLDPRVAVVVTDQKFQIVNDDSVGHSFKLNVINNAPYCDLIPAGNAFERTFTGPERLPAEISCSIHPWMRGYLVISDHPYLAVSDESGNFSIPELPPGEYTFRVWHERSGFVKRVLRDGTEVKWEKGRFTVQLKAGETKLGDLLVSPSEFEEK